MKMITFFDKQLNNFIKLNKNKSKLYNLLERKFIILYIVITIVILVNDIYLLFKRKIYLKK